MKRALRFLLGLYPAPWRARYGDEFEALLDDLDPRRGDLLNVALGALKMRTVSWQIARTIAILGMAGALLGGGIGLLMPDTYMATSVGRMHQGAVPMPEQLLTRTALSRIIQDLDLYPGDRQRKPLEDVIESMRARDIRMRPGPDSTLMISFAYRDPVLAQRTAAQLIRRAALLNDEAHRPAFEILDAARVPTKPIAPNRLLIACLGCAAGLLVGACIAGFRNRRRTATLITSIGLTGAILGFYASFAIPARYTSSGALLDPVHLDFERTVSDREALKQIIIDEDLYPTERAKGKLDGAVQRMQNSDLHTRRSGDTLSIWFTYPDRFKAQRVVYDIEKRALPQSRPVENNVQILDAASLPESAVSPNRSVCAMLGAGFGVLLLPLRRKLLTVA